MAAKWDTRISEDFFPTHIESLCSLKAIEIIKQKLNPSQQERFKASCFGKLFGMGTIQFSGQIAHHLLLRQVDHPEEELWFRIGGKYARFSANEFALVTGLNCGQYPSWPELEEMTKTTRLKDEYFKGRKVNTKCLGQQFLTCTDDDDTLKLALVYFLETVLLGRSRKASIDQQWLSLVEDLEAFNKFPWGKVSYEKTVRSLKKFVDKFCNRDLKKKMIEAKRRGGHYEVYGFTLAFQVWAYEAIPRLGSLYSKKKANGIPRILCWESKTDSRLTYHQLHEHVFSFKKLNVLTTLRATELESQQDYMSSITNLSDAMEVELEDKHLVGEDSLTDDGCSGCSLEYSDIENSAKADETGIFFRTRLHESRSTNAPDVPSTDTDPSKRQKIVVTETLSRSNPAHSFDTREISELQVDYNKNMARIQAIGGECLGSRNSSAGNGNDLTCNAQETEVLHGLSTQKQFRGPLSGKPSHVFSDDISKELNQPFPESENYDLDTLIRNGSRENPSSLHYIVQLDAVLQCHLDLDFCSRDQPSQPEDNQRPMTTDRASVDIEIVELSDDD